MKVPVGGGPAATTFRKDNFCKVPSNNTSCVDLFASASTGKKNIERHIQNELLNSYRFIKNVLTTTTFSHVIHHAFGGFRRQLIKLLNGQCRPVSN